MPRWMYLLGLGLLLTLTACGGLAGEPEIVATTVNSPLSSVPAISDRVTTATDGATIYAERCVACHGVEGRGDGEMVKGGAIPSIPDLHDPATMTVKTRQEYFDVITNGRLDKLMPPWKEALNEQQRWAVTDYVYAMAYPADSQVEAPLATDEAPAVAAVPPTVDTTAVPATAAPASSPAAVVTGTITGSILTGTAGMQLPADLKVTLYRLDPHQQSVTGETTETTVAADGSYRFSEVVIEPQLTYVVTTEVNEVMFVSDPVNGDATLTTMDIPVTVYDTGTDPALAQIDNLTAQVTVEENRLYVVLLLNFSVTGDRALKSVELPIPEGAQVEAMGSRYLVSADGRTMVDNQPVTPGNARTSHLIYSLPYTGSLNIVQPLNYAAPNGFEVVIADGGLTISGEGVTALGGRDTGMGFGNTAAIAPGETLSFNVSGFPTVVETTTTSTGTTQQAPTLAYVLIVAGVLAILAAAGLYLRDSRSGDGVEAGISAGNSAAAVNALVREIAALDVQHQAGKISDAAYEKKRYALKAQLMNVARQTGTQTEKA